MFNKSPYCHPGRRAGAHFNLVFNKSVKSLLLIATIVAAWAVGLDAATQINQTAGNPPTLNFTQNITAKAFDRETGTLYVATGVDNGDKTLAKAGPADGAFTPCGDATAANNIILANAGAKNLQLPTPLLSLIKGNNNKAFLVALQNQSLIVFDPTVNPVSRMQLKLNAPGGVNFLDNSNNYIVAAADNGKNRLATGIATLNVGKNGKAFVYGVSVQATPGIATDGVCSANIDLATGAPSTGQAAQTVGLDKVRQLGIGQFAKGAANNITAVALLGLRNGANGKAAAQANNGCWINDLYWDNDLQVLYAGLSVKSIQHADGPNISIALVKATLDPATGAINDFSRVTGSHFAFTTGLPRAMDAGGNNDFVFAVHANANQFSPSAIVRKICGMKTSTDKKYLILNASANNVSMDLDSYVNTIYAVRVATAISGTVAIGDVVKNDAVGSQLGDAWMVADLWTTQVGAAILPFDATEFVADMEVVGDTVYASVGTRGGVETVKRAAAIDSGVFSSRALFDNNGIIIGWTPWERVLAAEDAGGAGTPNDAAQFFAVDAQRGAIWKVCKAGKDPKVVKRTTWTKAAAAAAGPGLAARLNNDLADGCTAVLDLPKGTPGIGAVANATNSIALFGGKEKVVFAQTKSLAVNAVTIDFSVAGKYLTTTLPAGAGYVRALGFTRLQVAVIGAYNATNNFFFAGTDNGLYAFADAVGLGWNAVDGYGLVNAAPFNTYTWQPMAATGVNAIKGAVTAIEANGTNIFVVEQDEDISGMIVSKLHRFEIGGSISNMVVNRAANHVIIAQSGKFGIPENAIFTGFALVSDTGAQADAYGLLSTNAGIFGSAAKLVALDPAANPWEPIEATKAFTMINSVKRVPTGVPDVDGKAQGVLTSYFADASNRYFQNNKASILGINWADVWNTSQLKDYVNNANATSLVDRTAAFWTDGGRRIFAPIGADGTVTKPLTSLPFNTAEWNMTEPYDIVANNPALKGIKRIHWIENISGLGILMAGTDQGVVTLE